MRPAGRRGRADVAAALAVTVLGCALSVPPARVLIERSMLWHMVVQMPLLVAGGALLFRLAQRRAGAHRLDAWNRFGLTGFLAAQCVLAYWMLPLAVDRAVVLPGADAMKIASLLAGGAVLAHSFTQAPAVVQLYFVGSTVSMLVSAGAFLATTDRRLCDAYLLSHQVEAGWGMAVLGLVLGAVWVSRVLRAPTLMH